MSKFIAKYPTTNGNPRSDIISEIGSLRDCKFYIPSSGYEKSGLTFRVAYDAARSSSNHKDLCTYVGSMLSAVSYDLRYSVLEALRGAGIEPHFVQLPSQAREHGIVEACVTEMEWPLILLTFGCICILLLKNTDKKKVYSTFMSSYIHELQNRVGYGHGIQLHAPFDLQKANAIRTMLGASLTLRSSVMKLIMANMNEEVPASVRSVCQYLFDILSWSEMDELIFLNEKSPVLCDPLYSREAENLREALAAIQSHPYPQFFMLLASDVERMKVDLSRFPTLIQIAKNMECQAQLFDDDSD